MSAGGVFKLIANDGKADRMIMATKLLNQRIKDVMCARKRAGKADITPTLVDLERTHILFVNAHFKPFAAIGYEYNKVRPQSGNPALGNAITFSIPQFGDFFNDMVGRQVLSAFHSSEQTAPTQGVPGFPNTNKDWDNSNDIYPPHLQSGATVTYSLVDAFGAPVAPGDYQGTVSPADKFRNLVRYCEYPGERLYMSVKFDVNGNPLDEYYDTTINMLRKFTIGTDKMPGYKRLVGQETPLEGYTAPKMRATVDPSNNGRHPYTTVVTDPPPFSAVNPGNFGPVPTNPSLSVEPISTSTPAYVAAAFPDNAWDATLSGAVNHIPGASPNNQDGDSPHFARGYQAVTREALTALDGPQTPKYQQPQLEIWNKLRFWFNDDSRLSIASVSIPFGQRFITIDLAPQNLLCFEAPGLYVQQTWSQPADATAAAGSAGYTRVAYRPWVSPGTLSEVQLSNVELYVNNIFVNPEVHDIFIKRIGFSLIRVYRQHRARSNSDASDEKLLSQLKWPIEYMFVGMRPTWNISPQNPEQWRDWHRMCKTMNIHDPLNDYALTQFDSAAGGTVQMASVVGTVGGATYVKELKTVETMSLTAHGIPLTDRFPEKFYSAYNPFNYGGPALVTPNDEGAMMVNFALYPRSYQPSGHLNVSRAREFFLTWTTGYTLATNPVDLLVIAIAINFLLITDGSAVLRYST